MVRKLLLASTVLSLGLSTSALAEDSVSSRIERLEQEIKILKRQAELDKEEAVAEKSKQAKVEYGKRGFTVTSADGRGQLGLRGNTQIDGRFFLDDEGNTGKNEFIARRLRPILTGKYDDFSFRVMPDFAGGTARLFDAHVDYKFSDPFQLRFGKFKPPIGLERLQSQTDLIFIERGLATNLAPSRDFGFQAYGTLGNGLLEYQAGVFNGNPDLTSLDSDGDDKKDYVARVFAHPFKKSDVIELQGLGIGIAGSIGDREGSAASASTNLGDYRSPGQQRVFTYRTGAAATDNTFADGTHWRLYPQGYYYYGPFGAMAEYSVTDQKVTRGAVSDTLKHTAWQTYLSYVLTGEDATYKGVQPAQPFNLKNGGWGAFEIAGRVGGIDFDNDAFPVFANPASAVSEAFGFGLGLNWYLNERVKWQVNYDHTDFDGGAAGGADRPDEHALFTRVQYQF
jgi:phosphate-selective porin OprO/OprP